MSNPERDQAIALARQAVEEDKKENFEEAYRLYLPAIESLLHILKGNIHIVERNPIVKEHLSKKAKELIERAEEIHTFLETGSKKVLSSREKEEKKDSEDTKTLLKDALSSTEKPNVKWTDVAGLEYAKQTLQETIILPTRFPEMFASQRVSANAILLYGPPGTGKSFLAKACATALDGSFFQVSVTDLLSKSTDEQECLVKNLFETARANRPAVILIKQIASLFPVRRNEEDDALRRIETEFLVQLKGIGKDNQGVFVVATTTSPWDLDSAIRHRFQKRIYILLPEESARKTLFKLSIGSMPSNLTEEDFDNLARATQGFSGSDIGKVVKSAEVEKLEICNRANYFREVQEGTIVKYVPCEASELGARQASLMELPPNSLRVPDLTIVKFT